MKKYVIIALKMARAARVGINEMHHDLGERSERTTPDPERTSLADVRVIGVQFLEVFDDLCPC